MSKVLLIAEKPSVAREYAHALFGGQKPAKGHTFAGPYQELTVTVSSCAGHLVELAEPDAYNEVHGKDFSKWLVSDLPVLPGPGWKFHQIAKPDAKNLLAELRDLLKSHKDCEVVNGCDAGREGEVIFRKAMTFLGADPLKARTRMTRMWCSSQTVDGIQEAFNNRRPLSEYNGLALAGYTRDEADWLAGMNKTRLASKTLPRGSGDWKVWSVGRVQTPTLALIVHRDLLIENFKPQPFYEVFAQFDDIEAKAILDTYAESDNRESLLGAPTFVEERSKKVFWNRDRAEAYASSSKNGPLYRAADKASEKVSSPPLPLNMKDLQKIGSRTLGLTSKETLDLAQEMYEAKLITYPRTDSRHLKEDSKAKVHASATKALAWVAQRFPNSHIGKLAISPRTVADKAKAYNDAEIGDHDGLAPTGDFSGFAGLAGDKRAKEKVNLYVSILRAVLMALDEPSRMKVVTRTWEQTKGIEPYFPSKFRAEHSVISYPGFTRWDPPKKSDEGKRPLPPLAQGQEVLIGEVTIKDKETTPPKHYDEATILDAMELAGTTIKLEEVQDQATLDEMIKTLKEKKGIGTAATQAGIIETIVKRGYVARENKKLLSTPNGRLLIECLSKLDNDATSAAMTAEWEMMLKRMERGEATLTREAFLQGILDQFLQVKDGFIKNSTRSQGPGLSASKVIEGALCPESKKPMLDRGAAFEAPGFPGVLLWKNAFGKQWTVEDYIRLLQGVVDKQPAVFSDLRTRDGQPYKSSVPLGIDPIAKRVVIASNGGTQKAPTPVNGAKCPKTGEPVNDCGYFWQCPGWPTLRLAKDGFGRSWKLEEYLEVLQGIMKGDPRLVSGLVSRTKGTLYDAYFVDVSPEGKFVFKYPT